MEERYISVAEMAEIFSVSTTLIYKLIHEEEIPAIKLGFRNYRISTKTIEAIKERRLFA